MGEIIGLFVFLFPFIISWLFTSYIMYRIGNKFQIGTFVEYLIPIYNLTLICRCGRISEWNVLGLLIPIVNLYFIIHIWGSVALRLGKNYWVYGVGSLFLWITVLIMAFDKSRPEGYMLSEDLDRGKVEEIPPETPEEETIPLTFKMGVANGGSKIETPEEPPLSIEPLEKGNPVHVPVEVLSEKEKDKEEKKQKKKRGKGMGMSLSLDFLTHLDILSKIGLKTINELVGVDIGTTSIKVCDLKKAKDGFHMVNLVRKEYEEDLLSDGIIIDTTFVANELKNIFQEHKIKCKNVASALSSYTIITKKVVVPFLEDEELENTIRLEVESVIPFPLKDIYYSYHIIGPDEEKEGMMDVQLVAAKKEIVDGYMEAFNMAGLSLQILDVDIFAVSNMVEQIYNPRDYSVVVVDIGASVTNIAILKGEWIEFTREILIGGKYLTNQIEKSTRLSYREAEEKKVTNDGDVSYLFEDFIFNITSEITKTINFYTATKPNDTIGKIYLTGGSSLLFGLKEKIYEDTRVETELITPFMLLNLDDTMLKTYEDLNAFMTVALYLSTRVTDLG
ncbi:MAG: type IV pilus assembly protein PilM [Syntrophorhabdaceae bacterium]|nr:type IV pilus assembly protein PilM [Syntrophorhabdaceae bacterium]